MEQWLEAIRGVSYEALRSAVTYSSLVVRCLAGLNDSVSDVQGEADQAADRADEPDRHRSPGGHQLRVEPHLLSTAHEEPAAVRPSGTAQAQAKEVQGRRQVHLPEPRGRKLGESLPGVGGFGRGGGSGRSRRLWGEEEAVIPQSRQGRHYLIVNARQVAKHFDVAPQM